MKSSKLIALASVLASSILTEAAPSDLDITTFADSKVVPSPACLSAHPNGSVFVGVDLLGSLGKGPNKGYIVKLVDSDNDGKADKHTRFADIDNPRGLIAMGDKLYVLHTVIPESTGILEAMHLSVLTDADHDGVADGPPKQLIRNISTPKHNQTRGADHTTNGIRMGIDGWIYIAVGDFGFVNAVGTDGKTLTQLGGGILRVRPDGSEMEVYTHGLRNIYDVAIDPFMNIYTRGNTNDGGGWNVRFIHQIQSGQYGYPMLFKNFTEEIIPALVDVGGGSGTGALFMDEPTWPDSFNQVPMMADWGRNQVYIHRLTPDGPSFTQKQENFIGTSQPSDLDVDGSGRLFIAAWAGAGYKGNPNRGHVQQVTPKGWEYKPFPTLEKLEPSALVKGIRSPSAVTRLAVQQELLNRESNDVAPEVLAIANDATATLESRIAAVFTYKQMLGENANAELVTLASDKKIAEWALRALADRVPQNKNLPLKPFYAALKSSDPRVQVVAATALGRIGKIEAAPKLLEVAIPPKSDGKSATRGPVKPAFTSEVVKDDKTIEIEAYIKRFKNLYLIVDDVDGNGNDHAAWINPTVTLKNGKTIDLTERKWKSAKQGWGTTAVGKSPDNSPLLAQDGSPIKGIGTHAKSEIVFKLPKNAVKFTAKGALPKSGSNGSIRFIVSSAPLGKNNSNEGPHATPNSDVILPHVAIHSLVELNAIDASLNAIGSPSTDGALRALQLIHDTSVVDSLIEKFQNAEDPKTKDKILRALARLYTKEAPYDGSWWWNTKPDTRGPYYVPVTWEASPKIETLFRDTFEQADDSQKSYITHLANKYRMNLEGIGKVEKVAENKVKKVGDISIENVMLALEKKKGNSDKGKKLMKTQACIACHAVEEGDREMGPSLARIGSTLDREAIAEAILKPDATIAENWVDVTKNDGSIIQGTLVTKSDDQVVVRNIAGIETKIPADEVKKINKSASTVMGPHLLDGLTLQEFINVVDYLHSKK